MSKVKVQQATKELAQGAGKLLEEVTRVRRSAQDVISALKKIENGFIQKETAEREAKRQLEQSEIIKTQTKAWTMPDTEDVAVAAAPQKSATVSEPVAPKAQEDSVKAQAPQSNDEKQPTVSAQQGQERPFTPQQGRPVGQPGQPRPFTPQQGRPVGQPGQPRPFTPQQGRPVGQPGQPRPFTPQQGRPVGQPGQYGQRPFTPQQGRPVGQPGQYGQRPFTPQQGRPVGQPGQYGRPAYGQSAQGGQARPAGQFGRPAYGQGGGQYGQRPAYGQGGGQGRSGGPGRSKGPELTPTMEKERVSNYDPNKRMYQRQHDPEHIARNRKQIARGNYRYDDDFSRNNRRKPRKPSAQMMMEPIKIETAYMTAETITVKDLTERIGKPAGEIIKKLLLLGIMATINQELDFDTAQLVCSEFGVDLEMKIEKTAEDFLVDEGFTDDEADLVQRPPVITIMGHVDHGKTSLLDYIRKAKVTSGEAGGITQHIGAYTVSVEDKQITFLDTPGHEAFTAMRARGTQATDIAILVVAADDGVMPQTIESINHAKAAKVPMIVAINKIDKETADIDRVKQELTRYEIVPEEWGGDTIMLPVSAHTGEGIDALLENILLLADVQELRANPNRKARGVVIEAKLDKARGPVATVLVQNGTLNVGDMVVSGMAFGRIRAMVNSRGERVKVALPSTPVEVIGFSEVPEAGEEISAVADDKLSRQVVEERRAKIKSEMVKKSSRVTLDELYSQIAEGNVKDLNVIIKADVQGSVEAVKQSLDKLSNDEVRVRTIHSGVGAVTENDVMLASIDNAIIIGFNVRADAKANAAAERDNIDLRYYRVIYQAIEDVEKAMKGMLTPEFKENILGHAEIRNVFKVTGVGTIAGSYITDGKVQRNAQVRLLRDNIVIFEGKLDSLKRFKDDAKEVASGYECGIGLEKYNDIKEGDIIECFVMEEVER